MSYDEKYYLIKKEILPDGSSRLILKDKETGKVIHLNKEKDDGTI